MGGGLPWVGIEVRHFAALKAVAEEASFSRAAERLGYTQSAVSQQIAALERITGHRLLTRPHGAQKITLTDAGERVLRHADEIVARISAAAADLDALQREAVLRVGVYQSVGTTILPAILADLHERNPDVTVELEEAADESELLDLIVRGRLDLTFSMLPLPAGPFASVELLRDPYVLLAPAGSELAEREDAVGLAEVAKQPLISFRHCRKLAQLEEQMRARGLEATFVQRSDDNATIQALVASGAGVAFVPRLAVNPDDDRTVVVPLAADVTPRVIVLVWHKDRVRPPAADDFVAVTERICAEVASDSWTGARTPTLQT